MLVWCSLYISSFKRMDTFMSLTFYPYLFMTLIINRNCHKYVLIHVVSYITDSLLLRRWLTYNSG